MSDTHTSHKDRIVLITGASRGIGYAAAKAFAAQGAQVVALARGQGGLEELDDEITAAGGKVALIPVDITDRETMKRLPAALGERFGRIDAFIANAGVLGDLTPVPDILPKSWDNAMAVNVTANAQLIAGLDGLLRASPAGRVVGISSSRAQKFVPFWGIYSASKAAFEALLKVYAMEMSETDVRVNIFDPGATRTDMRAEAMPGEDPHTLKSPDDLAPLILALAAPQETRTGEVIRYADWAEASGSPVSA